MAQLNRLKAPFLTPVGMNRVIPPPTQDGLPVPHTRGDEPGYAAALGREIARSSHPWG